MKKFAMTMTAVAVSAFLLAGCGDEKAPEESVAATEESSTAEETAETETVENKVYSDDAYLDNLNVADFVELGEYLGVEVSVEAPYVSDEDVENAIQSSLVNHKEKNEITGRAVQDGDVADISYVGKKDGEAFDGGTADNYELTIGSNSFIDGFEDGVIGMEIGETKDLNLTFPENYGNADLAGAEVVFTVTVNKIYEEVIPEFTDEFVKSLEIDDVVTTDDYRQFVYDALFDSAQAQYDMNLESAVLDAVFQNTTIKAEPEAMAERYYDRLVANMSYQAGMYGFNLETFMFYFYGMTAEDYEEDMKASAKEASEQILMMQAIAEKEGLTVSDEEVEADIAEKATMYGYESADAYKEDMGDEVKGYREYLMSNKVTEFLVKNAKVTELAPETEDETVSETETETETGTETATEAE